MNPVTLSLLSRDIQTVADALARLRRDVILENLANVDCIPDAAARLLGSIGLRLRDAEILLPLCVEWVGDVERLAGDVEPCAVAEGGRS